MADFKLKTIKLDVELHIPANKVLIIGDSGVGKSYLISSLESYAYAKKIVEYMVVHKYSDIGKVKERTKWVFFDEIETCSQEEIKDLSNWILLNNSKYTFISMYRGGSYISAFSPMAELVVTEFKSGFNFKLKYKGV